MSDIYAKATTASFRIFSNWISPEEITAGIGIEPDRVHYAGRHMYDNPQQPVYRDNMWVINSKEPETEPLERHLTALLLLLEPNREFLHKLPSDSMVDFFCGLFSLNGCLLSAQLLKRMGDFGFALNLDIYGESPAPRLIEKNHD